MLHIPDVRPLTVSGLDPVVCCPRLPFCSHLRPQQKWFDKYFSVPSPSQFNHMIHLSWFVQELNPRTSVRIVNTQFLTIFWLPLWSGLCVLAVFWTYLISRLDIDTFGGLYPHYCHNSRKAHCIITELPPPSMGFPIHQDVSVQF